MDHTFVIVTRRQQNIFTATSSLREGMVAGSRPIFKLIGPENRGRIVLWLIDDRVTGSASLVEARQYAPSPGHFKIVIPYRPAASKDGFAISGRKSCRPTVPRQIT